MAIRIGFIGAGLIANWHREMLQTGGADVVWSGVFDVDRTRAHTFSVATGAGPLIEHSIHDVDLLEYLCGPISSVTARSHNFHGLDGIEDTFAAAIGFDAGTVGTLASIWHDVLERPSLRQIEIFTERLWCRQDGSDWYGPVRWCRTGAAEEELGGDGLLARLRSEVDRAQP